MGSSHANNLSKIRRRVLTPHNYGNDQPYMFVQRETKKRVKLRTCLCFGKDICRAPAGALQISWAEPYTYTHTVNNIIIITPETPLGMRSGVVYSIPCKDHDLIYTGIHNLFIHTPVNKHKDAVQKGKRKVLQQRTMHWMINITLTWMMLLYP